MICESGYALPYSYIIMTKTSGRGFTIVELLIVIVIIGILAAVVVVAYRGITNRAYYERSRSEMEAITKAIQTFNIDNGRYPYDVNRGLPAEISPYLRSPSGATWPDAPWPNSVYDYDDFIGSDGNEVVQMSIRFCPSGGAITDCHFPNESWAAGFDVDSSAYWCVIGKCKSHPTQPDTYPGYCMNCRP